MHDAAANLEFEEAAQLRDEIRRLEATDLGIPTGEKRLNARIRAARNAKSDGKSRRRRGR